MRRLLLTLLIACAGLAALPPSSAAAQAPGSWVWPVRGDLVTGYRNGGDPYAAGQHRGIDIGAPEGTRVDAAASGTVTFAGIAGSSGRTVSLRTRDGRFDTSYLHLGDIAVREGDRVEAGDRVGSVGTSGRRSAEQPHLHFGVREAGNRHAYRNPLDFLPPLAPRIDPPQPPEPVPVPASPRPFSFVPIPAAPQPAPASAGPRAAPVPVAAHSAPIPAPAESPPGWPFRAAHPAPVAPADPGEAHRSLANADRAGTDRIPAAADRPSAHAPPATTPPHRSTSGPHSRTARPHRSSGPAAPPRAGQQAAAPRRNYPGNVAGFDLGWLAACIGLVAVALALGRPAGPVVAARHGRRVIRMLARPLTRG